MKKLTIEPLPKNSWGISLANILPTAVWNVLRREVYSRAIYKCEICGCTTRRLHCHEEWIYNDQKKTQKLSSLRCLCEYCHDIKHWGKTVIDTHKGLKPKNYLKTLEEHFCSVNNCSEKEALLYRTKMGDLGQFRSRYKYKLSFGIYSPTKIIRIWSKNPRG